MISIIGSGRVGSAIAFLAATTSLDDIVLVNRHKEKAEGQALDISNAIPADSPISVVAGDYSEIRNSDVIAITASTAIYVTSRVENLPGQLTMIKEIAKKIAKYADPNAKILIVSNPVDILTYFFQKEISWPRERVWGVASSLDSSRFRYLLAKELDTRQSEIVDALVLGEHGDSMVPIFSLAKWNKTSVLEHLNTNQVQQLARELRGYWKILRKDKGPSVFGITKNTFDVIRTIVKKQEASVPASVLLKGEYRLSDVCLGVPVLINSKGIKKIKQIDLDPAEYDLLHKSAAIIKKYIKDCTISIPH